MIRAVVTMLLLGGAALGALRLVNSLATLNAKTVRLDGDLTAAEGQEVRHAVARTLARPGINRAGDVAREVLDLGWVRDVQVRRLWPDVLHVSVSRRTLAARWGDAGNSYLTTSGNIVSLPAGDRDPVLGRLPVLQAAHASSAEAMRLSMLLDEIARAGNLALDRLEQDDAGNWIATVAGDIPVILGNAGVGERLRRFMVVHERVLGSQIEAVEQVDARYETGVSVRWKQTDGDGRTANTNAGEQV